MMVRVLSRPGETGEVCAIPHGAIRPRLNATSERWSTPGSTVNSTASDPAVFHS